MNIIACICFFFGGLILGFYIYHRALRSAGFLGKLAAKKAENRLKDAFDVPEDKPEPIQRDMRLRRKESQQHKQGD